MSKKKVLAALFIVTALFISIPPFSSADAAERCEGSRGTQPVWWDGAELKVGQIGRLTVLKDTPLYKLSGSTKVQQKTLKAGGTYRIYAFKPDMLSVGGGMYLNRDSKIKYETPSAAKMKALACKKESLEIIGASIKLGDSKSSIEAKLGKEKRISLGEYGVSWHTYHNQYRNFYMIGYVDNKAEFIYSNSQRLYSFGIFKGSSRSGVTSALGTPIKWINKNNVNYVMVNNEKQQTYYKKGSYITVFYDIHKKGNVTGIQLISGKLENRKDSHYGAPGSSLQKGLEMQMFDLVNAARADNGLAPVTWNSAAQNSARKHSLDMAENNFFDHMNLRNESPFQRMEKEGIHYLYAGENIAMGYSSSIFAHEALMNSAGHRKNILNAQYTHLGAGVQFQKETAIPYYTQNFFTPY
ncbi:CAP-associated domain-containing protein [Cytobacillus firmus]|uniref:CAP domain-containing protein n=1 Tax=Cytobacillus firmus TaxID=1399 RepID=UPI0036BF67E1